VRLSPLAARAAPWAPALTWAYLLGGRGRYWVPQPFLPGPKAGARPVEPVNWPRAAIVVPARDEAALLPQTLPSLLAQDYPGHAHVVLVDDRSSDRTAELARSLAATKKGRCLGLAVLEGRPPPAGWAGKTWAMAQGVEHAMAAPEPPDWLLFTDADIYLSPGSLRRLVASALASSKAAVSLMARLSTRTAWERLLMPAFVYFFAQIYPFEWVNDPARETAAAAGGCLLVNTEALAEAGGMAAVAGAAIDDVALAKALSAAGYDLWLGLAGDGSPEQAPLVESLRRYPRLSDIWEMVARNAYTQLQQNPWALAGTVAALCSIYLAPPALGLAGVAARRPGTALAGLAAWTAMAASYLPTARYYRASPATAIALPFTAALYAGMTIDSARRHRKGASQWKGRALPAP
jgi:hopene-associated glycosyltransferase HpnB